MTGTTLYFGTDSPQGAVSAADWQAFVDEVVTPRFPAGLTHWAAAGQWRDRAGDIVREDSRVLMIVHPEGEAQALADITSIYKERFRQEAVLVVRSEACVSF